ncbi:MAG: hypothetical protein IH898_05710 [Planctomycetes bacterium]|nr:hypothetical protein [Planctomycetota bacterium]
MPPPGDEAQGFPDHEIVCGGISEFANNYAQPAWAFLRVVSIEWIETAGARESDAIDKSAFTYGLGYTDSIECEETALAAV